MLSPLENSSQDAPSWQYRAHDKTTLFFLVSGLVLLCLLFLAGGKGLAFLPLFAFSLLAVFGVLMPACLVRTESVALGNNYLFLLSYFFPLLGRRFRKEKLGYRNWMLVGTIDFLRLVFIKQRRAAAYRSF